MQEARWAADDGTEGAGVGELMELLRSLEEEAMEAKRLYIDGGDVIPSCIIGMGTDEVVAACAGTVTPQGVVALMDIPQPYDPIATPLNDRRNDDDDNEISPPPFYLLLDGLSDPGNVGTLLRTCAAADAAALFLLPGSCDVWNPKAVRSAMGASFRIPVIEVGGLEGALEFLEERCGVHGDRVYAATMDEGEVDDGGEPRKRSLPHYSVDWASNDGSGGGGGSALILGKEGEGLSLEVREAVRRGRISSVHVPMAPGTESLNAAVCGSVVMFERMRQLAAVASGVKGDAAMNEKR